MKNYKDSSRNSSRNSMEELVTLGKTQRKVSTFGTPILVDANNVEYQLVSNEYTRELKKDSNFDYNTMRVFDFKLKRGKGKKWMEPPRRGVTLYLQPPNMLFNICSGKVDYILLERKRSVGIVYFSDWTWDPDSVIPDFTK